MKFRVLSDLHLEKRKNLKPSQYNNFFAQLFKKYACYYPHNDFSSAEFRLESPILESDTLILAGDIASFDTPALLPFLEYVSDKFSNVIYVPGNHEYYCEADPSHQSIKSMNEIDTYLLDICSKFDNVYFLNNSVIEINKIKIAGCTLWTPCIDVHQKYAYYQMKDRHYIYTDVSDIDIPQKLKPQDINSLYNESMEFLSNLDDTRIDIVVTHHLPSKLMIKPQYLVEYNTLTDSFASNNEHLIEKLSPSAWIAGHTHNHTDKIYKGVRLIVNPVGNENEDTYYDCNLHHKISIMYS